MIHAIPKRTEICCDQSNIGQSSSDPKTATIKRPTPELYRGKGDDLVLIGQKQFAVVGSNDAQHLVGTCYLGACVAVVAQSTHAQLGFCTHFDIGTDLEASASALWKTVRSIVPHDELIFRGHLVGGQAGSSEELVEFCKTLNVRDGIRLELICSDILGPRSQTGRSIVMDSRDGRLLTFEPFSLPAHWEVFARSPTAKLRAHGRVAGCAHMPDRCGTNGSI